jgi:hypothetical protein
MIKEINRQNEKSFQENVSNNKIYKLHPNNDTESGLNEFDEDVANEIDSIFTDIDSLIDNVDKKDIQRFNTTEFFLNELSQDEKEEGAEFGPRINFQEINLEHSFDSLEYDLCFDLKSPMFNSILNEEEMKDNDNSKTIEMPSSIPQTNRKFSSKLNNDSPQLPKNLKIRNSPFLLKYGTEADSKIQNQSAIMTEKNSEKRGMKTNFYNNDLSFNNKKHTIFCCSTKPKTKFINNSFFSNNFYTHTKKSTNISSKSLKLNDSLTRWRKKKNMNFNLNKSEDTNISRKDRVNCRCLIF